MGFFLNTYDNFDSIHRLPTNSPFDNYTPIAMVYMNHLCIETSQPDMALQSYLLQMEKKEREK